MSRDIKYIGLDVHKEATVIAVVNECQQGVCNTYGLARLCAVPRASGDSRQPRMSKRRP